MNWIQRLPAFALLTLLGVAGATVAAVAQESPTPQMSAQPTQMDREYDGQTHVILAPYIWAPSIKANIEYSVPQFRQHKKKKTIEGAVSVGPANYISSLNSAAMFGVDVRKGDISVLGDYIYLNASSSASAATTISGPLGHVQVPVTFDTSAHIASSIWELAAAVSVAHGHNADLNFLAGVRQFPVTLTLGYNLTVGKRYLIAPSGSLSNRSVDSDTILGLQGKAYYGNGRFFTPYYIDMGFGPNNNSWEAYTGAGYSFEHGQSVLVVWRNLNYDQLSPVVINKLVMGGPLLGYTFAL
jgi:hypothetical protein